MEIKNHILQDIKFLKSPNFNERPENIEINLLVIHSISLPPKKYNTDHIEKFFMNVFLFMRLRILLSRPRGDPGSLRQRQAQANIDYQSAAPEGGPACGAL